MRGFDAGGEWPKVSVVIRCKNERPWLERVLRLLGDQDYPGSVEILVVDSGSTDGTRELALPKEGRWLDMRPEDFSYGASLNLGCREAVGEFIVLLSAHCFPLFRSWLRELIAPFAQPGIGLVYGRQVGDLRLDPSEAFELEALYPPEDKRGGTSFSDANGALPKALFEACPFTEDLPIGEEAPLVRHVLAQGLDIYYRAAATVEHGHPADPPGLWRRSFREGWVLEKEHYRGSRSYSPLHLAFRLLTRTLRSTPRILQLQGSKGFFNKLRLDALRLRARHQGARTAQRGHPCLEEPPPSLIPLSQVPLRSYALPGEQPFCLDPTPSGEARVRADLERIAARLRAEIPTLQALLLAGGFGRGEGILHQGRPQNDYDLELVVGRPVSSSLLQDLSQDLAQECRVDWVDLEAHTIRQLRYLSAHTQYGFDLAHGARLLWSATGHGPLLLPSPLLPFVEAEKILSSRLWALLYSWPPASPDPSRAESQMAKSILALADARLIVDHAYCTGLAEKRKSLRNLPLTHDEEKVFSWAFAHRLGEESASCPLPWASVRDLYLSTWARLVSKHRGMAVDSPDTLARAFQGVGRQDFLGRFVRLLSRARDVQRTQKIREGILLLAQLPSNTEPLSGHKEFAKRRSAFLGAKYQQLVKA